MISSYRAADFIIDQKEDIKMNGLRKCKGRVNVCINGRWQMQEFELGYFHQWGMNFEEFENGPGNYSVAIVELPDGRIVMPTANDIEFLDKPSMF